MSSRKFRLRKRNLTQKQIERKRRYLSFFLFVCMAVFSICCCLKISVFNVNHIVDALIDSTYINALQDDIHEYATDACLESGIGTDSVDEVITYQNIYDIENSYITSLLNASEQFNNYAFNENIAQLKQDLIDSTKEMLTRGGVELSEDVNGRIDMFATQICDYTVNRIEYSTGDLLVDIVNIASNSISIIIAVLAIIIVLATISLLMTGNTYYRNMRYLAYSLTAATILDFVIVGLIAFITTLRPPALQPSYVAQAMINYIDQTVFDLFMTGLGVLCVSLFVLTLTWRLKRDKQKYS